MPEQTFARPRRRLSEPIEVHHPHWTAVPLVLAALALPLVPWSLVVAVTVPWMASVDGLVVNGAAVLRSHPVDLLPVWAVWGAAAGMGLSLLIGWGTAVRIVADTLKGHTPHIRTAFLASARRLHLSVLTAGVTGGMLYAVDALVLTVAPDTSGPTRYLIGAAVFVPLAVLWRPPVVVHTDERGLSALCDLRGRALLTSVGQSGWVALAAAVGAPAVFALSRMETTVSAAAAAAVFLVSAAVVAGALTFAAVAPGLPEGAPIVVRTTTSVVCVATVLVSVVIPAVLAQRLIDDGPWPALSVERTAYEHDGGNGLELTPSGATALMGDSPHVCDTASGECLSAAEEGPGTETSTRSWTGTAGDAVRWVHVPDPGPGLSEDYPPGTVAITDACLYEAECGRGAERIVEPEPPAAGVWNVDQDEPDRERTKAPWQEHMSVWAGRSGDHHFAVTAMPSAPFSEQVLLSLVSCTGDKCDAPMSVPFTVLDEGKPGGFALGGEERALRYSVDTAVGEDDRVVITVHDVFTGALTLYSCEDRGCDRTSVSELAVPSDRTVLDRPSERGSGKGAVVEVRPDGTPVALHSDPAEGSVHLSDCRDRECTAAETVEIAGPSWRRPMPALSLDNEGLPQIAFHDPVERRSVLVSCTDTSCGEYDRVPLGTPLDEPSWMRLALDGDDRPVLFVSGDDHEVESVRCTQPFCRSRI